MLRRVGGAVVGGVVYSRHKFPAGLWRRREVEFGELWWSERVGIGPQPKYRGRRWAEVV
jgi:hypothetical protein